MYVVQTAHAVQRPPTMGTQHKSKSDVALENAGASIQTPLHAPTLLNRIRFAVHARKTLLRQTMRPPSPYIASGAIVLPNPDANSSLDPTRVSGGPQYPSTSTWDPDSAVEQPSSTGLFMGQELATGDSMSCISKTSHPFRGHIMSRLKNRYASDGILRPYAF